ncbi:MAG: aromatic amino acid hydroxylase [Firmicutes bacterium]|nr:aromatic amino acid hydroxylase [Bacillota bacterium]
MTITASRRVPAHLRSYVVRQHYEAYTPVDQAVWRFVMRQNRYFLEGRAHPAYLDGLTASGISIERIPHVEEMNRCLGPHGFGAETIGGFIPGVAFYDFQAHGILPIATGIRKLEHIDYTPAPDILHEAAGHAPILCDPGYAHYVKVFGEIGAKALASQAEHEVFDAVKHLSDILEDGTSSPEEIAQAKEVLAQKQAAATVPSEAELIARLYWWTVEYGLYGDLEHPLIYGAGLLSSIGESRSCLTDAVQKLPFDLEACLATPFDITTQQPQLFVCQSFDQLTDAVRTFAKRMAFMHGGVEGLRKAVRSGHTATVVYDSGLQVSGTVTEVLTDHHGEAAYLRFGSACALAYDGSQLPEQGKNRHPEGFSSPVGRIVGLDRALQDCTVSDLKRLGIVQGTRGRLLFSSGVEVGGLVTKLTWQQGKLVLITWSDCTVTWDDKVLFAPAYGPFDMAVGATIRSVFADAADPEHFYADTTAKTPAEPAVSIAHTDTREVSLLLQLYSDVRQLREDLAAGTSPLTDSEIDTRLTAIHLRLKDSFSDDWLLRIELYELLCTTHRLPTVRTEILADIRTLQSAQYAHLGEWIDNALALAERPL